MRIFGRRSGADRSSAPTPENGDRTRETTREVIRSEVHAWKRISLALAAVSLLAVALGFGGVVVALGVLPLKQVHPMLAVIDKRENAVFRLQPLERTTESWDIVTEVLVCQYVTARNEIRLDAGEMSTRWGRDGFVRLLSSRAVYERFAQPSFDMLKYYEENEYLREVTLLSEPVLLETIGERRYYRLDFRLDSTDPITERRLDSSFYTANVTVAYGAVSVLEGKDRFLNPIGLQVVNYAEGPIANEGLKDVRTEGARCGRGLV